MSDRLRLILLLFVMLYAIVAIRMIHRKKLSLNYSLLWLVLAGIMLLAVLFPDLVYSFTHVVGVELPLNMIFLFFCIFALILLFYLTSIVSKDNEKNRALTQQIALLEKRVRELEEKLSEK